MRKTPHALHHSFIRNDVGYVYPMYSSFLEIDTCEKMNNY